MKKPFAVLACALLPLSGALAQVKETIQVNIVEVPVIVVDRAGNPVRGLTEKNFELFDEGKKQPITSFDVIDFASRESLSAISPLNPIARRSFLIVFDLGYSSPNSLVRAQDAARALGLRLQSLEARGPGEIDSAFVAMGREQAGAVVVLADSMLIDQRTRIADLAARRRLPMVAWPIDYAEAGGLMAYGPSVADMFRRAATYVDRILKGAKAADLPIEQPTKFELVINLRAAKALGLAIPQSLLLRADQVMQ